MSRFQNQLLEWYEEHKRDLPWRQSPSIYKTVISEFMLQQTRVETVLPYFKSWLNLFPDFDALAKASEEQVVKAWEGLGYYSRARNLRKLAIAISEMKDIPKDPVQWQKLPGIGPYTSAAICSISFQHPIAVVDGNVIRVLSRIEDVNIEFNDNSAAVKYFTPRANQIINHENPGDYNQAMMELGATICHRQKPLCLLCPVNEFCNAYKNKTMEKRPSFKPRKIISRQITRGVVIKKDEVLLFKHPKNSKRLANVYEFPELPVNCSLKEGSAVLFSQKRSISNERITETFYQTTATVFQAMENTEWIPIAQVPNLSLSGPHKKWFSKILSALDGK